MSSSATKGQKEENSGPTGDAQLDANAHEHRTPKVVSSFEGDPNLRHAHQEGPGLRPVHLVHHELPHGHLVPVGHLRYRVVTPRGVIGHTHLLLLPLEAGSSCRRRRATR